MLNLKKLEEKLDAALAQETPETMLNWLNEKRTKAILGKGVTTSQEPIACTFDFEANDIVMEVEWNNSNSDYKQAA